MTSLETFSQNVLNEIPLYFIMWNETGTQFSTLKISSSLELLFTVVYGCTSLVCPPFLYETHNNPLYSGRLFHCYILDESICLFRVSALLHSYFIFDEKSCLQIM